MPTIAMCPNCGDEVPLFPNVGSMERTGSHYAYHQMSDEGLLRMCPRSYVTHHSDDLVPIKRDERGRVER